MPLVELLQRPVVLDLLHIGAGLLLELDRFTPRWSLAECADHDVEGGVRLHLGRGATQLWVNELRELEIDFNSFLCAQRAHLTVGEWNASEQKPSDFSTRGDAVKLLHSVRSRIEKEHGALALAPCEGHVATFSDGLISGGDIAAPNDGISLNS